MGAIGRMVVWSLIVEGVDIWSVASESLVAGVRLPSMLTAGIDHERFRSREL